MAKKITKECLEDGFVAELNDKATQGDLTKYMPLRPITVNDLDPELRGKVMNGTGLYSYDDTGLRTRIVALEAEPVFIKGTDVISETDMSPILKTEMDQLAASIQTVNALDTKVNIMQVSLQNNITTGDSTLDTKIDSVQVSLQNNITTGDNTLDAKKADKTDLDNYRSKSVAIAEADMDDATKTKLDNIPAEDNIRMKADPITQSDLESNLSNTINSAASMSGTSRQKSDPIMLTDLDITVQTRLNQAQGVSEEEFSTAINEINNTYLRNDAMTSEITTLNSTIEQKFADMNTSYDSAFRKITDKIIETDLGPDLTTKIDGARQATVKIVETDLDATVSTKLDGARQSTTKILESDLDTILSGKIDSARQSITKITETDLDTALDAKINASANITVLTAPVLTDLWVGANDDQTGGDNGANTITLSQSYKNFKGVVVYFGTDDKTGIDSKVMWKWELDAIRDLATSLQTSWSLVNSIQTTYWMVTYTSTETSWTISSQNSRIFKIVGIN